MDEKTLRLFELNRRLVDRLKTSSEIFYRGTNMFELIDTTLISFDLPNVFIYKNNQRLTRLIPESLKMSLKKATSPRDTYTPSDYHRGKVAVFIPNNKQMDIYQALASESKDSNTELIPILWNEEVSVDSKASRIYFNNHSSVLAYLKTYYSIRKAIPRIVFSIPPTIIEDYCRLLELKYKDVELKLENVIRNTLARSLLSLSRISSTAERLQKRFGFDSAVFTNEREELAKFTIFGLKQAGIRRTYGLQRGVVLDHPEVGEVYTDSFIVDGEFYKRNLLSRGCNPKKIQVLGSPRLDILLKKNTPQNKLEIRSALNIPNNKIVFLIITEVHALGVTETDQREYMEFVLSMLKHIDNGYFLIKAHPNQTNIEMEKEVASKNLIEESYAIYHKESIFDLIIGSDFVITEFSTVGTEALAVGKPLLVPKRKKEIVDWLNYEQSGLAFGFFSVDSLKMAIKESKEAILDSKYVEDIFYKLDGLSCKRVLEFVAGDM